MKRLCLIPALIVVLAGLTGCISSIISTPCSQHPLNVARQVAKGEASLKDLAEAYGVSGASTSSNAQGGRVCFFDNNNNDRLDDAEILEAIKKWISGEPVDGEPLTDKEILEFIGYWISGKELGCRPSPVFQWEEIEKNLNILNTATEYLIENKREHDLEEARAMTISWLKKQPTVKDAGVSDDGTIWIEYVNGLDSFIFPSPPTEEPTLGEVSKFLEPQELKQQKGEIYYPLIAPVGMNIVTPGNREAIILSPFHSTLFIFFRSAPEVQKQLDKVGFTIHIFYKEDVTVDRIKELYKYGVIYIDTHGGKGRFLTGELVRGKSDVRKHWDDWANRRISPATAPFEGGPLSHPFWAIHGKFITYYAAQPFPRSLVFINACKSFSDPELATAFLEQGAYVYLGWTDDAATPTADKAGMRFFQHLATGKTVQEAYDILEPKKSLRAKLKFSPEAHGNLALFIKENPPKANFTFSPSEPKVNEMARFTDQSTDPDNDITSWSWDFGDGFTSTSQNPSHSYNRAGTYTCIHSSVKTYCATGCQRTYTPFSSCSNKTKGSIQGLFRA